MVSRDLSEAHTAGIPLPRLRLTPRVRIGAVVVLLLAALAVAAAVSAFGSHGTTTPIDRSGSVGSGRSSSAPPSVESTIYIHLLGAVARPGLYTLPEEARAIDAIAAAGGFATGADEAAINLARYLSDGEQLYVPLVGEVPAASSLLPGAPGARVNLNLADAAALETLPRVGPAMAARIIAWRETNGRFSAIEDLQSVTGIGEKTFEALRDLVTV